MTVYKYFLKNAFRRKGFMLVYFIVLMSLSVFNSISSVKDPSKQFEDYKPSLAIINDSKSELSGKLVEYLNKISFDKKPPSDMREAREWIFIEKADVVVYIPEDFEQRLDKRENCVDILYDSKNIKGHIIENQLYKYLLILGATKEGAAYDADRVEKIIEKEVEVVFREGGSKGDDRTREQWFSFYFTFSGYIILAVLIGIIGLTMSDFQKKEVVMRVQASAARTSKIQIQTYLAQMSITAIVVFLVIFFGILIQKGRIGGVDIGTYIINLCVFSFSVLGLTFMINNLTGNKYVKSALSTVLSLGMAFISGVMIPQEYIGSFTLNLAKFLPMYYFVRINDQIHINSSDLYLNLGIQLGFAGLFLAFGLLVSHLKRKKIIK